MFKKKIVVPTTVAEAIQPFRDVQTGLAAVLEKHIARKQTAAKRIEDAKAYAEQVAVDETAASEAAALEIAQAQKISDALAKLLGDDVPA
ncbi:hypothetical protein vBRpoSV10_78 [Ruegeria phage vB_RpoS-V10]|nr:hypothetical protein DSS3P8_078 [Roseobacter phage DSS3P8]AWY09200.1 hypothetical protein vBRpoSV10_78 [Ruegeria phage vB_RpoS-V10]